MNDETLRQLEKELSDLRPAAVPESLRKMVAAELDDAPLTFGDRILAGFMGSGALAAALIVAIILLGATAEVPRSAQNDGELAARQRVLHEYQLLLAQR